MWVDNITCYGLSYLFVKSDVGVEQQFSNVLVSGPLHTLQID